MEICNFCNRSKDEVTNLVCSNDNKSCICNDCAADANGIMSSSSVKNIDQKDNENKEELPKNTLVNLPTPKQMFEHLNRFVIGQEDAKKINLYSCL